MAEVSLHNVSKAYKTTKAVSALNLTIADGEFVVLLGPTGAGKTTTLRLIAGLEKPDSGTISIGGCEVDALPPPARDVAFVFQQFSLYPHLSVYDNLAFPLRAPARRVAEDEIKKRVERVAGLLRIDHKLANKSTQLSGGEMQRVAIGRSLVRQPAIYLMDEPLSSLDAKLRADLRIELKRIQADFGSTILYVTHDQVEAMTMANRIGVLHHGELVQVGTPRDIYETPNSIHVAQKLGQPQINLVPVGTVPALGVRPGAVTLGARTEHIEVQKKTGAPGIVEWIEHLGDQTRLHMRLAGQKIITLIDHSISLVAGDRVSIKVINPICFDAHERRIGGSAR
jgi:multiple sugar transport system ATP-binding protein